MIDIDKIKCILVLLKFKRKFSNIYGKGSRLLFITKKDIFYKGIKYTSIESFVESLNND